MTLCQMNLCFARAVLQVQGLSGLVGLVDSAHLSFRESFPCTHGYRVLVSPAYALSGRRRAVLSLTHSGASPGGPGASLGGPRGVPECLRDVPGRSQGRALGSQGRPRWSQGRAQGIPRIPVGSGDVPGIPGILFIR